MSDEERRVEALKLSLTYFKMKLERCNASVTTPQFSYTPNSIVKTAEEFEYYLKHGKPIY